MANVHPIIVGGINLRQYRPASDLIPVQNFLNVVDQKTQNTDGGSFASGAWRTRDLNTVRANQITGASLAANQITLPAGNYVCQWSAPAYSTSINDRNQTRLQNITDAATVGYGSINRGSNQANSLGTLYFSIAASKVFELQHITSNTRNTDGFGRAGNFAPEIYSQIHFWKVG